MSHGAENRATTTHRRGSVYVLVLSVAVLVMIIGVSSLTAARIQTRVVSRGADARRAEVLALSAVERAVTIVSTDPAWRTTYVHDVPTSEIALGGGFVSFKLVDQADTDLAVGDGDAVRVYGTGRVGNAVRVHSVLLEPTGAGLDCLGVSVHIDGDIVSNNWDTITSNQTVSSNGFIDMTASNSIINADAEAVGAISGNFTGSTTSGVPPKQMPGPTVSEHYLALGTWIDINDIPVGPMGNPAIAEVVLSPASNPFGSGTNPQGIYVIDCAGLDLKIRNSRIVGTLVLIGPGPLAKVSASVNWAPAVLNYPALLVIGDMVFRYDTDALNEADRATNFNPVGTPYQGSEDADTLDTYPSMITGLVYVSGTLDVESFNSQSKVDGVIVAGQLAIDFENLFVTYESVFVNHPPPGFGSGDPMIPVPGTWRWEVEP